MRKIFLFLTFLINFYFLNPVFVYSQSPTPFYNLTFPGINCGQPEDPLKNQCCHVYYPATFIPPDLGPLNVLTNMMSFFTNNFVQANFLQPLLLGVQEASKGTIQPCVNGVPSTSNPNDPTCKCINAITPSPTYLSSLNGFCQRQTKQEDRNACLNCANNGGVYSGIGCVYTDAKKFIQETVFNIGIGLAGSLALLCILYAAFQMQSSQGNPEKLKKSQEMITSCIMGLMLIIFSVFILRLIGVNILRIPGFQ